MHTPKKGLAERLGIQRTSLSRELNKMKKDDLVDYDSHSIAICNFDIIRKL
ncbi:helix-turn-helix domain-containing protein [Petroclostridium sp. X23]|uniref:helix-turn-helix domain-containing protein n=1 Tax=Petroclostridium sp. X23 TaxID=3045146 RepID=UPI0024ACFED7|nr:helix-turn-helix domain-containing protein [Petroclostridium sp. X23]WHH61644.1 helix-turn-helix domain-containing protein [Petroclostridium sp. X23]